MRKLWHWLRSWFGPVEIEIDEPESYLHEIEPGLFVEVTIDLLDSGDWCKDLTDYEVAMYLWARAVEEADDLRVERGLA